MMKIFLILMLLCGNAWSAELLVQAVDSPFEKGAKKGDVIAVRPDGWSWGKEECLPRYIVIKLTGIDVETSKKYEEPLTEQVEKVMDGKTTTTSEIVRLRKYNIGSSIVDSIKFTAKSSYDVPAKILSSFTTGITEKTLVAEKMSIAESELEISK
jgi:hypothetical protein